MKVKTKALLLIIFILLAAAMVWQNKSQTFMAVMGDALSSELSKATGTTVVMGPVEIGAFGSITIHGITMNDRNDQPIVTAGKVVIGFNPIKMFLGDTTAAAVGSVTLVEPRLTIQQRTDGSWSIEDLLDSSGQAKSELNVGITVIDGTAEIRQPDQQWLLTDINGAFAIEQQSVKAIKVSVTHDGATADVQGAWNSKRGSIEIHAANLDLKQYQVLMPADSVIQITGGKAATAEVILSQDNGQIHYAGEAGLAGADIVVDGIPLTDIQGNVAFTDSTLYLFNTAKVFEQPLKLQGSIAINTTKPVLDLVVSSPGFDLGVVNEGMPITGTAAFQATVAGLADNPTVDGQFSFKQMTLYGQQLTNTEVDLNYRDRLVTLKKLQGVLLHGQITAQGTIEPDNKRYSLHIQGTQLETAMVPDLQPGIQGAVDFDVVASGGENLDDAVVFGTASIANGQFQGIDFTQFTTSFYKNGPNTAIDYLNVGLGSGMATASGTISTSGINMNIQGNGLPLDLLAKYDPQLLISGIVDLKGTIGGTMNQPQLQAEFAGTNGQVFHQPFAQASGRFQVSSGQLVLQDVLLVNGVTRHTANGWVGLQNNHPLQLTLNSRQARAEDLVKLIAPGEKLTGNVDNDLVLSGTLDHLEARGRINLTEGSFRGFLIAQGAGEYERLNGTTQIRDFVIHSLNTQVKISGAIMPDQQLDFDITAKDVDIARVHMSLPYPIAGQANFSGKLKGTVEQPAFDGELKADKLILNSQQLNQVDGKINVQGNQIAITSFGFQQGAGKFSFSGGFNTASNEMYGDLAVENGQLASLLAVLNTPVKGVDGQLNGRVLVSGNVEKPNVELTGNLKNGNIKKYPLDHVELDILLSNNIVTVKNFTAQQGQGVLAIHGTADLNGPLNMEIGGRDIDAGLITNWFDADIETKGSLNFAAQVSGTTKSPSAAVSLEIAGGGVANATFDSLYGLLLLDQGSIHVNQLMLTKGAYRASAYGVIPVAALTAQGRQQAAIEDQMDLKVRLDEADLSIMPLLTKEVSWAVGRTQGEVTIGGTLAQPTLNGAIVVQNGVVKLASLADPIQKVGLDIRFDGDKINLKSFEGFMGAGSYQLTGSARLNGLALSDYHFDLKLDKLGVNSKYFKGPLNGELTLESGSRRPKLAGNLLLENATIDLPYIPEMTSETPNIALDVEIVAGKKVRLYNPYLYDIWAEGRVKFAGTTLRPDVSGRFDATRGTISYLRTSFKIKEASAEFTQFASFEPVIKFNAETRLDQTKVYLTANGPVSSMGLQLTSEPSMSQQEILSLLTLRSRYFDKQNGSADRDSGLGRDEMLALLDTGLQIRFVSELESAFRTAFGLDEFRLVRDTLSSSESRSETVRDREFYNIEIGKYLTDRFMLNYTMGIGYDDENSLGFRYDLTRTVSLTGSYDRLNRQRFGIETRFKF